MKLKDFFDSPEEIFVWAMLQFPLYFVLGWHVIPVQLLCGLLGRWGGVSGGFKPARRIGVPIVVCLSTFLVLHQWGIFLALPFMIWGCPFSYGADSWLFKTIKSLVKDQRKADFLTRITLFGWYWLAYGIALLIPY